jgi:hypothetical protein
MSTLWLLLVPLCCALYTLLLPIAPNDFWYNARAGAEIAAGRYPTTALWTTSVTSNTPYFYQSWIAQWLLFKTLQIGGLSAIVILRTVVLTSSFALIQWAAWRRSARLSPHIESTKRARIAAMSTLLGFALSASNMDIRPQTFSVPLFCIFAFCIFEWPFLKQRQRTFASAILTLLMLLWVNTHGAFFTGFVLVVLFAIGESVHTWLTKYFRRVHDWFGEALSFKQWLPAGVLCLAALVATLLNPRGIGIYSYVLLLANFAANQKFIEEWQAPTFHQWYGALFFLAVLLFVCLVGVLFLRAKSRVQTLDESRLGGIGIRFSELLVLIALAVMAMRDVRSIIWFALFATPLFTALITRLTTRSASVDEPEVVPRGAQIANAIIALLLLFSIIPLLPAFKGTLKSTFPPEYLQHFAPTPRAAFPAGFPQSPDLLLDRDTPVEAVEFLRTHPPRRKLWNDFVYGSYLVWATLDKPQLAPWADPRVEMRPLAFWEDYGRACSAEGHVAQDFAEQGFSDALIDTKSEPKLRDALKRAGWREVFARGRSVVLRRNVAE